MHVLGLGKIWFEGVLRRSWENRPSFLVNRSERFPIEQLRKILSVPSAASATSLHRDWPGARREFCALHDVLQVSKCGRDLIEQEEDESRSLRVGQRPLSARRAKRKGFSEHASNGTQGAGAVVARVSAWCVTYNYGLSDIHFWQNEAKLCSSFNRPSPIPPGAICPRPLPPSPSFASRSKRMSEKWPSAASGGGAGAPQCRGAGGDGCA